MSGVRTVHPEASTIVRRIFDEALAGKKPGDIARGLNEDGVLTPGLYFRKKYPDNGRFGNISEKQTWNYYKVHVILRRLVYTGAAVGGLRKQLMPCKKVTTKVDREEWVVVPDMHEAIITSEEYEQAQKVIGSGEAHNKNIVMYPLRSLIICGYCGRHMIRYKAVKGENAIQARLTNETGVIISWDDYAVKNADIQLVEAVRLSVSGRNQIVFTPLEALVIDRYGDYDRNTTRGKLDILSGRFKDPDIEAAAVSVTQKLGRISDQSYADMYAVGQRRQKVEKVEKGRSLTARIERAKVVADKHNTECAITPVKGRRGMEI